MSARAWVLQGGAETMLAYGVTPPAPMTANENEWHAAADALRRAGVARVDAWVCARVP